MSYVLYHCATWVQTISSQKCSKFLSPCAHEPFTIFSLLMPVMWFKPSILQLRVTCFTRLPPGQNHKGVLHLYLLVPMKFFTIFSLLVLVVGFKPSILQLRVACFTTVLLRQSHKGVHQLYLPVPLKIFTISSLLMLVVEFKPSILQLRVTCFTLVLPGRKTSKVFTNSISLWSWNFSPSSLSCCQWCD